MWCCAMPGWPWRKLSAQGTLVLDVRPASAGDVLSPVPGYEMLRGTISIPEVAGLHRFAVQWMADDAFQLHAFPKGADYGQPGRRGRLARLAQRRLPDLAWRSRVGSADAWRRSTYPAGVKADVVIRSAVTEATCGRELLGEVLESQAGIVTSTELALAMPGAGCAGDILVMKNRPDGTMLANSGSGRAFMRWKFGRAAVFAAFPVQASGPAAAQDVALVALRARLSSAALCWALMANSTGSTPPMVR